MAYAFKRTCTVDHTQCGSTDSTDFPVSVVFTDTTMKLVGSGGHINHTVSSHGQTVPADLAFFSDSGLTTLLKFEIESYNATAGTIVAWVKIPTLSHTSDTVFYMGYDDAGVTTFQGDVNGTWNSAFKGVYHLPDGTTLATLDSTVNAADATNHNATPADVGRLDGGAFFTAASSQYLSTTAAFAGVTALTVSIWLEAPDNSGSLQGIVSKGTSGVLDFVIAKGQSGDFQKAVVYMQNSIGGNTGNLVTTATVFEFGGTTWHHFVVTWDGTTVRTYVDAAADVTGSLSGTLNNSDTVLAIGAYSSVNNFFEGILDEVRISNVARSVDWITADFNSQKVSSTFLAVGAETPVSGTAYTLTADVGSYAVTGTSATITVGRRLTANVGSYTVTGTAATLTKNTGPMNYTLTAASGSYVITGTDANLIHRTPPSPGTFPQSVNVAIMGLG